MVELLEHTARVHGWSERSAYLANGLVFQHAEVYKRAGRAAAALAAQGVDRGSRVLIALPDGIDFVTVFLGAMWIGAVAIPANVLLHPAELARAAEIAQPAVVVCESETAAVLTGHRVLAPETLRDSEYAVPPFAACEPGSVGFALFTSGTTGDPRLCFHTHADPLVINQAAGAAIGAGPDDVCYSVSRMYFAYGLSNSLFFPLLRGAAAVLTTARADAPAALATIAQHQVSVFYGQPSFYARLLEADGHDQLGRLRVAVAGGEPLLPVLERRLRVLLGDRLLNMYGTTEIGYAVTANGPGQIVEGTVGRVMAPYRVRVVDDDDAQVLPGDEGRLQVCGPTISPGVERGDEQPRRLGADEWYTTGDAAVIDGEGVVRVLGRADDIEIVGGANVHPGEIEDLLSTHPAVSEVAVCSVWRREGVSTLRAYVVVKDSWNDARADVADARKHEAYEAVRRDLLDRAAAALTWYKVPEDVVFTAELPRSGTGKLLRRTLRAMANSEGNRAQ
ncbi:class I adenylate-forming enzyme family protein [Amycolatopsis sp. NPDC059090]|uniref:class I adenylate-forming enzyme family protein n=1 Tax=Amycolatopsis sp. NPDC059090 TaxID=3346723 RepID=UPI00366F117C